MAQHHRLLATLVSIARRDDDVDYIRLTALKCLVKLALNGASSLHGADERLQRCLERLRRRIHAMYPLDELSTLLALNAADLSASLPVRAAFPPSAAVAHARAGQPQ